MEKKDVISNSAESIISNFYNTKGWTEKGGHTLDAIAFEDLRDCAINYLIKCRLKLLEYIPASGDYFLDMASGPIQYKEYLSYSKNYKKRFCVDLSEAALIEAESKIGQHGVFLHGSFFDLKFEDNFFDCIVSIHTIYHIDKELQESAIRKMISIVKHDRPIIIIYSNPNSGVRKLSKFFKKVLNNFKLIDNNKVPGEGELYFYTHPLDFFKRFNDVATVEISPWRTFGTEVQKKIFPNNIIGKILFKFLFFFETHFKKTCNHLALYPIIILRKK
jgi:ubiquinone/menaquinone biosynthesis C-methylase UbiE